MTQTQQSLNAIGIQHNTDKASMLVNRNGKQAKGHNYLEVYEFFLQPYRNDELTLLELGIGPKHNCGKSLLTWKEYFPKAQIVGVDIRQDVLQHKSDRIEIEIGDTGNPKFLSHLSKKYKPQIVIDDASHLWKHQIIALQYLYPQLQPGGIYIIEDIHTSFGQLRDNYSKGSSIDAYEYFLSIQTALVGRQQEYPIKLFKDSFSEYACENTLFVASLRDSVILKKKP